MIDADTTLEQRADALARVLSLTHRLAGQFDLDSLLSEVLELGMRLLDAEMGTLWLYQEESGELVSALPHLDPPLRLQLGQGLAGICAAERRIINVLDAAEDPRFLDLIGQATGFHTRSLLNVPLVARDGTLIGVLQFLDEQLAGYDQQSVEIAAILAAQCTLALQQARASLRLQQNERLQEEVELARQLQMSTLPTRMPTVPGYEAHGHFLPTTYAGGDLFDLVLLQDKLFLLLGDATGHGFGPALSATQMQGMLRVAFRCGASLEEAYRHVNNQLAEDLPPDRFITAFMGFLDPATHELRFHSGGQGPILHFHAAERRCEWHQPTSFPVGIVEMDDVGEAKSLALAPGDILALLSDGLYEYPNPEGELFGEARVAAALERGHEMPMAELCRELIEEARRFAAGAEQADDITVVLLRRLLG